MLSKKESRLRRARKSRCKMKELGVSRLCVYRTPRHIYAQIIAPAGDKVLVSASTIDKEVRSDFDSKGSGGNISAASRIGQLIAERAKAAGIDSVAFDRSGFKYHGRVKALADAAREGGLEF